MNRVEAIDKIDKLCKFRYNQTKNVDFIAETRNANFQLKMATFPIPIVRFSVLKINRIEDIDKMYKLCKFHKNPTKNVDFMA